MTSEMPAALHKQIEVACAEADLLAEKGDLEAALVAYNVAWALIPDPKTEWDASTWVLAGIGEVALLSGFKSTALDAFESAMHCPGAIGNSFLHLRLGQLLFDTGEEDRAADELTRAYVGGGPELFAREDPKYSDFLKTRIAI